VCLYNGVIMSSLITKNERNKQHQWFVYESKICRTITGISQLYLAKLLDQSLEVIKRIETRAGDPKSSTKDSIRTIYNHFGVSCHIEDSGITYLRLNDDLVEAINQGKLKQYSIDKGNSLDLTKTGNVNQSNQLIDLVKTKNQWTMIEVKLCRIVSGLTQEFLGERLDMKPEGVKRIERGGAPKYITLLKLRRIFDYMGIRCSFNDYGEVTIKLRQELMDALNTGKHTNYKKERSKDLTIEKALVEFKASSKK